METDINLISNTSTDSVPTSTEVIQNLQTSEIDLESLNNQFDNLRQEYKAVVNNLDSQTFFNFDNVYFWFVISGLLLLVFGLCWWLMELKKDHRQAKLAAEKSSTPPANAEIIDEPVKKPVAQKKSVKVSVRKSKKSSE